MKSTGHPLIINMRSHYILVRGLSKRVPCTPQLYFIFLHLKPYKLKEHSKISFYMVIKWCYTSQIFFENLRTPTVFNVLWIHAELFEFLHKKKRWISRQIKDHMHFHNQLTLDHGTCDILVLYWNMWCYLVYKFEVITKVSKS